MLLPGSQPGPPLLPVRNAGGESPTRYGPTGIGRRRSGPARQGGNKQPEHSNSGGTNSHDPSTIDSDDYHRSRQSSSSAAEAATGSNGSSETSPRRDDAHLRLSSRSTAVDRGLAGIAASLRSSWSTSSVIMPPTPNGEAIPTLLSHLAELRSVCKRQRESGKIMRGALVRKQGQLDDSSAEAAWLRAELGFIVGDMLGALQRTPTGARAVFSSLSERIRSDLGAEEAVVYVDIGDGTLWLLPTGSGEEQSGIGSGMSCGGEEEVFIQRGVGVVGLVAMGALPGVAAVPAGGGERAGGVDGGVDVLLLNDGLEAFDNGTTVEAALLRAAQSRRAAVDGYEGMEEGHPTRGSVRNMLLARVGSGVASSQQGSGCLGSSSTRAGESSQLPDPPTAVIQALNKRVAPGRFTEGDARAVRTLAPAIAAGSRLIISLLNYSRNSTSATSATGGRGTQKACFGRSAGTEMSSEELLLLHEGLRRAREGLGADRVRLFGLVPASEVADGGGGMQLQLQLWHEDPAPHRPSARLRSSGGFRVGGSNRHTVGGLHEFALSTGRVTQSSDALSDPLYDREPDVMEGFLARSVLCAPLLENRASGVEDAKEADGGNGHRSGGNTGASSGVVAMGVLEWTLGRGAESVNGQNAGFNNRDLQGGLGESGAKRTRKAFVEGDEPLAEAFAREIAGLLSRLLAAGYRPGASATSMASGGGRLGTEVGVTPTWEPESEMSESAFWKPQRQQNQDRSMAGVGNEPLANSGRLSRADLGRPPQQQQHAHGEVLGQASTARDRNRSTGRHLGISSASTAAGLSPLGPGVRASLATAGQKTPDDGEPPPSPATEDRTPGGSPSHNKSPNERVSEEHGSGTTGAVTTSGGVQQQRRYLEQQQQEHQQQLEATQAQSWATAHQVLQACRESLAANKLARHRSDVSVPVVASISNSNVNRIASAVCTLVPSLLPGCSATLLLLDQTTGRLREASRVGVHPDSDPSGLPWLTRPRQVRHENLARRALSSGKALLSRMVESTDAVQEEDTGLNGRRIFCVPVCGSAEQQLGVLQFILPPPPGAGGAVTIGGATAAGSDRGPLSPSSVSRFNHGEVTPPRVGSSSALSSLAPPPPSFFMAAKIVSDSVGLALGWCEAMDRTEDAAEADRSASAKTAEAAAKAREQSHAELEATHKEELRFAHQSNTARAADAAEAHARAVASLLEGAANTMAVAKGRRQAARVLVAWREISKRAQRAESNAVRIKERQSKKALREWKSRTSALQTRRMVEATGAATLARRGLRRAIGKWTRAVARRRFVRERRMAGARLMAEVVRRKGPVKRCFGVWKVVAREVLAERQALAQKDAEERRELLVDKEVSRIEARAQVLSERMADLFQRRRSERVARAACQRWLDRVQRVGHGRENERSAEVWRRKRGLRSAMTGLRGLVTDQIPADGAPTPTCDFHGRLPAESRRNERAVVGPSIEHMAMASPINAAAATAAAAVTGGVGKLAIGFRREDDTVAGGSVAVHRDLERAGVKPAGVIHSPIRADAFSTERSTSPSTPSQITGAARSLQAKDAIYLRGNGNNAGGGEVNGEARQPDRLALERLAEAAASEFRYQRDRHSTLRVLTAWRSAMFMERSKREALLRRMRDSRKSRMSIGFLRWRAGAWVSRTEEESRRTREGEVAMAAARAEEAKTAAAEAVATVGAAVADRAAAEKLMRDKEEELQREKTAREELLEVVEKLKAKASENALQHQAVDAHLQERSARASILSFALAQVFRQGRERLAASRAFDKFRDVARARRLASAAAARITALRLSRGLIAWSTGARQRSKLHNGVAENRAAARRMSAFLLSRCVRSWGERARRGQRRRHALDSAVETRSFSRQRTAIEVWRDACRRRETSAATKAMCAVHLRTSTLRRGLCGWKRKTFGGAFDAGLSEADRSPGEGRGRRGGGGGGGGGGGRRIRASTRLEDVAGAVNAARSRRRARAALQRWLGHAQSGRRLEEVGRQVEEALHTGSQAVALLRWRALSLLRRSLREKYDRGAAWAAFAGARKGWEVWRKRVRLVGARRNAHQMVMDTTVGKNTIQDKTCRCFDSQEGPQSENRNDAGGPSDLAVPASLSAPPEEREVPTTKPSPEKSGDDVAQQIMPAQAHQPNTKGNSAPRSTRAENENETTPPEGNPPATTQAVGDTFVDTYKIGGDGVGDSGDIGCVGSRDLLDLLVDVCAAPPPYPLGSGVATLGSDACTVAIHTFGLLSASLFEVVGSSPAMAVRVASVQAGGSVPSDGTSTGGAGGRRAQSESAAAAAAAAVAEFELPDSERLGDGTVGVAAQSARPVCMEVVCRLPWAGCAAEHVATAAMATDRSSSPSNTYAGKTSTVLCLPVMLQSVSLPKASPTDLVGADCARVQEGSTIPSVEVVGVLRAVRLGSGAFAGDDARALSAFCGQLALAMVADRTIAGREAQREKDAIKEARALRRQACRKVAKLFTEGAVAGALLRHAGVRREASSPSADGGDAGTASAAMSTRRVTKEELWGSVAGLAAQALGCERVDLLRLTSISDGGAGPATGADGVANFLSSQRQSSRSFRRRSREALLAARAPSSASSQSVLSSGNGEGGGDGGGARDAIGSWLCIPVLGVPSGDNGGGRARTNSGDDGAATVCCAVNKRNGRSFDDVDEAMLGTIAALYAVAASWLPPPSLLPESAPPAESSGSKPVNHTSTTSTTQWDGNKRGGAKDSTSSVAPDRDDPTPVEIPSRAATTGTQQLHQPADPSVRSSAAAAAGTQHDFRRYRFPRPEPRLLEDEEMDQVNRRAANVHVFRRDRPPPPVKGVDDFYREEAINSGGDNSGNVAAEEFRAFRRAAEENALLRGRAERAEKMLETTRGRLCKALEDGVASAAAAAVSKTAAMAKPMVGVPSSSSSGSVLGARKRDYDNNGWETGRFDNGRARSIEQSSTAWEAEGASCTTPGTKTRRRRRSGSGGGGRGRLKSPRPLSSSISTSPYASSSEAFEGENHYHSDETGMRRQRRRRPRAWEMGMRLSSPPKAAARRRHHRERSWGCGRSLSAVEHHDLKKRTGNRFGRRRGEGVGRGGPRIDDGGSSERISQRQPRQPPQQEQQGGLLARDAGRVRRVLARLEIAARQLEEQRAGEADMHMAPGRLEGGGAGGAKEALSGPARGSITVCHECGPDRPRATALTQGVGSGDQKAGEAEGEKEREKEAAVLARENAKLRRRLFGLAALEELEGRAVKEGLLPLTGGGTDGDMFSAER